MIHELKFFRPSVPEGYEWAMPDGLDGIDKLQDALVLADKQTWTPIHMSLVQGDMRDKPDRRADMPWFSREVLILRDDAVDEVGPMLEHHGLVLPLQCDQARLAVFVAPLLDGALDEDRSSIVRFSSGRIMDVRVPRFNADVVGELRAFRLAEVSHSDLFLAGTLVDMLVATGLTGGTDFKLVQGE